MQPRTDKELRQLAKQIHAGEVFFCNKPDIIQMSFMVLLFMEQKDMPEDVGAVYEFMSKASPRSINGYPIFFSCHFVTMAETQKVIQYVREIEELLKDFE